jgi:predicted RNA-binding protein YlqC (UPF0109 family)
MAGIRRDNEIAINKAKKEADGKNDKTMKAKTRVSELLADVATMYNKLNEAGEITNTDKSIASNLAASVKSSDLGQMIGRMTGSDAQSIRQTINQARPLLMNEIRQASEMGAKGLDSEKELEFYLQAVSDPKRDIQANMAALKVLDRAYGLGVTKFDITDEQTSALKKEYEAISESQNKTNNLLGDVSTDDYKKMLDSKTDNYMSIYSNAVQ